MNKFWKNVLHAVLIIAISGGVAAGVTAYVMMNNGNGNEFSDDYQSTFKQPVHLASLNSVAAENTDFTYAAEKTVNAVVHLRVTSTVAGTRRYTNPLEDYFFGDRQQRPRQRQGSGSGVIISTDGYIMTANHVIEGADSISVILNDKRTFIGKLVGGDATTDIALIKIEADDLQPIPFGDSDVLKVGEWVLAVGNPFDLTSTVTAGIVSAKGRPYSIEENSERARVSSFIQTDAAVNPGNSGGALVNTRGELVGINTAIISQTGNFAGYSFAIPISIAGRVVSDLQKYGALQRGRIGITMGDPVEVKKQIDPKIKVLEGVYVDGYTEYSSAKEAGIEIGDVITAVNGIKVTSMNSLQEQIMKYQVGEKVIVKVDRYGTEKEFTVELLNAQGNKEIVQGPNSAEILGAAFRALSDNEKRQYRRNYGIVVTNITRDGKIRESGIRDGFIILDANNQRISTPEDFYGMVDKILQGNTEEKGLFVRGIYPNGSSRLYAINLVE